MKKDKHHIVFLMANNSSVPYFLWFAEKAMNSTEFKFSFILLHDSPPIMIEQMKAYNCDCYWIPFSNNNRKSSILKAIPRLVRLFKSIQPDIVHSHLFDDTLPAVIAAKIAGIKHRIVTKQDTTFHWFYAPKAVKFDRLINRFATNLIAVSEECRSFIIENEKADASKISMIHHGIPLDKLSHATEDYKNELITTYQLKNKIVVGTVARLIGWKGHKLLLEVLKNCIQKYPNLVFLFTGEGELKAELLKIIKDNKLENNVILTGWIAREKIPSLFAIMDIYIHGAKYEPFGFVIAEAMLNAAPVLSTKTGAAMDAIQHKENGYLVNYDDVSGFIDGIDYLLNTDKKEIGLKGKQTASEMFNFDKMYNSYIQLYKQCLTKN